MSLFLTVGLVFAGGGAMLQTPTDKLYGNPLPDGALTRMGTERLRHPYARGIAFAADGKTLISAGQDQVVRFWDTATGQLKRIQRVPRTQPVVALSPDGKTLALVDKEKEEEVILWDVTANKEAQRIPADKLDFDTFLGVMMFSTDGKTLAAGSWRNGAYRIWDISSGKERWRSKENMGLIALSPDGKMLASCTLQGLAFWDAAAGKKLITTPGPKARGGFPSFSPDGKLLAVEDRSAIAFYETATGKEAAVWQLEIQRPENIAYAGTFFSPDGKTVAVRYMDHVALWDRTTRQKEKKLLGPSAGTGDPHAQLCFSPDGKQLACLRTGAIVLWDVATGKRIQEAPSHFAAVESVAFSPDGKLLASASGDDHTVRLWDSRSGEQLHDCPMPHYGIGPLIFTPDGANLIAGRMFEDGRMWDVRSGKERCIFRLPDMERDRIAAWHLSPDGRRLTALSLGTRIKDGVRKDTRYLTTWDVASGKRVERRALAFDSKVPYDGDTFSPDGKLVATLDPGNGFQRMIFDVVADRPLRKLPGLTPLAFSPDSKIIASGGAPAPIQLIEVASGGSLLSFSSGDGWPRRRFTLDGRYLVTAGEKDLRLWELATGKEVLHQRISQIGHPSTPYLDFPFLRCLAIAPDGRSAATGLGNTNVLVWDLAPETRQKRKLTAADLDRLWADLAGKDAAGAYRAAGTLIADPERAMPFLSQRLQAVKEDAPRIRRLAADLDSEQFPVRDAAFKELEKMDDAAHTVLRQELAKATSLEQRRRIETLLRTPWLVEASEKLRQIRAVMVLEQIGDLAARRLLERLAGGTAEARQTREAKTALQRLQKRF